jgi:ketosteroid isomerase-like protein
MFDRLIFGFMKRKLIITFVCLGIACSGMAQTPVDIVSSHMSEQQDSWNEGDLEAFMIHYWKSDSLKFIGSKGLTYGWQQTLANYKTRYPDRSAMGQLNFTNHEILQVSDDYVYVIGKWELERKELENLSGHYTLLWQLIKGQWVIISDHSS